mmetsp:Transcript_18546/g.28032  ORF Transcript_18546/g.28032 Transcript_18546/m.28032 type:complete len:304 (-) Transcript_18546:32-943(-)
MLKRTLRQILFLVTLATPPTTLAFVAPKIAVTLSTTHSKQCSFSQLRQHRRETSFLLAEKVNGATVTPSPMIARKRVAGMTAFLTAWANVALFTHYQTFATMMTGNSLWWARSLVRCQFGMVGYYTSVIASYISGLVVHQKQPKIRAAALVGLLFVASQFAPYKVVAVSLLAMGFGIINSIGQDIAGTLTFVITGHMTKLTHDVLGGSKGERMNWTVIGSFFLGGIWSFLVKPLLSYRNQFFALGALYSSVFLWHEVTNQNHYEALKDENCSMDDDGGVCRNNDDDYIVDDAGFLISKNDKTS